MLGSVRILSRQSIPTLISILAVLILIFVTLLPAKASETDVLRIQSIQYQSKTNSLILTGKAGTSYHGEIQRLQLANPDRLMIDIPEAYLSTSVRNLPIQQNGLERVEVSQSLGTFYQVVRLTVYAKGPSYLNNLQIQPQANTIGLKFLPPNASETTVWRNSVPQSVVSVLPKNKVLETAYESGTFKLIGENNATLRIKNQFTLPNPKRLVIDLADCTLANKSLSVPIDFKDGPFQTIRLGQFDENTVRVVIESQTPGQLYVSYPENGKNQIAISNQMGSSIKTLPQANQMVGFIKDVTLSKQDDASVVQVKTTVPMVRQVTRKGDQIEVELINIAARPSFVAYDKQTFSEIGSVQLSPLKPDEPNTKLVIALDNPRVELDSHLSLDGKTLELKLTPNINVYTYNTKKLPTIISPEDETNTLLPDYTSVKKGQYTVVVDAGHGGKDIGANRVGVYEKYLNLSVALKLKQALENKGVTVCMTRATDKFLALSEITGITNRIRPDAFVSVHTNASVNPSMRGIETYFYTPQSRDFASRVHRRMVNNIASPDRGVRTAKFYVIHHTQIPAILCEMGYISNSQEREELQTESRQNATAESIAQGVVEFLSRQYKAGASSGD